jgi:hypothetical protein
VHAHRASHVPHGAPAREPAALLNLKTLPKEASLVVVGAVISTRTTQNDRAFLEKLSTIQVGAVLHGQYTERILRIRTRTGLVFFDRHLEAGDGGVFFLKPSPRGDFEAAEPGAFALFEKGTFEPATCLESTTLNGMTIALADAERIGVVAERYLAEESSSTASLPPLTYVVIDCHGTVRLGAWILEATSTQSEVRLSYRVETTAVSILREEMTIQRVGNDWKVLRMGRAIHHFRR